MRSVASLWGRRGFRYLFLSAIILLSGFIVTFSVNFYLTPDERLREIVRKSMAPVTGFFKNAFSSMPPEEQKRINHAIDEITSKQYSFTVDEEGSISPFSRYHMTLTLEDDDLEAGKTPEYYKEVLQRAFQKLILIPYRVRLSMGKFIAIIFHKQYKSVGEALTQEEKKVLELTTEFNPVTTSRPHISLANWLTEEQRSAGLFEEELENLPQGQVVAAAAGIPQRNPDRWEQMKEALAQVNRVAQSHDGQFTREEVIAMLQEAFQKIRAARFEYEFPMVNDVDGRPIDLSKSTQREFNRFFDTSMKGDKKSGWTVFFQEIEKQPGRKKDPWIALTEAVNEFDSGMDTKEARSSALKTLLLRIKAIRFKYEYPQITVGGQRLDFKKITIEELSRICEEEEKYKELMRNLRINMEEKGPSLRPFMRGQEILKEQVDRVLAKEAAHMLEEYKKRPQRPVGYTLYDSEEFKRDPEELRKIFPDIMERAEDLTDQLKAAAPEGIEEDPERNELKQKVKQLLELYDFIRSPGISHLPSLNEKDLPASDRGVGKTAKKLSSFLNSDSGKTEEVKKVYEKLDALRSIFQSIAKKRTAALAALESREVPGGAPEPQRKNQQEDASSADDDPAPWLVEFLS